MPYFNEQKKRRLAGLADRLADAAYTPLTDLQVTAWVTPEPVAFAQRESGKRLELKPGMKWGDLFDCAWFHFTGQLPPEAAGEKVVLLIDLNGEASVVDEAGAPVQGLTNVNSVFDYSLGRPGKRVLPFAESARGGEAVDVWADAGCNDLFGNLKENGTLKEARIAICHPNLLALHYDVEVLHELMLQLPEESARRQRIFAALDAAAGELLEFDEAEAQRARAILAPELAKRGGDPSLTISAIGHAHIDLAWLWPLRETIRKGARTFATSLRLMERYPDYVFGSSQPQLYQWMKDHYPALYAQIRQRIAEGRWEAQGAMWVEADANVTGGESLARQILYGKRFFRAEFGKDVKNLWLPDVFGYSGALPQLLKKAGVDYFMTQKLSWNTINHFPHHTFRWEGIDGTQILAHMLPEETYNSPASPRALAKAEREFRDKTIADRCLMLFGIGDGGGGPGEEHLERLAREKNLAGLPPVQQEPAERFFKRIAPDWDRLPSWSGELYLERHQGTYTTQARSKRANRKMEIALRDAEWSASLARWVAARPYPAAELEAIWKEVLLYQFHDILPGSSIGRVYRESLARYAVLQEQTEQLAAGAEAALYAQVNTEGLREPVAVSNSLSWERREWLRHGDRWLQVSVPPLGYTVVDAAAEASAFTAPKASPEQLENEFLRVRFSADGSLASVWDKENEREALAPGAAGNRLAVYRDEGDAWDMSFDYAQRPPEYFALRNVTVRVDGPRAMVRQEYSYGQSTLTQEVVLEAGSRRLDFVTIVDWRETGRMLRTSFPLAVQAREAACEIQFGHLTRPTHRNTSWDLARFEICAQRWIDLSDRGYGVALLNDCKYGHRAEGSTLDLNLLRSPGYPDPEADRAEHHFTYALLPHAGDLVDGEVVRAGYALNVPLRLTPLAPGSGSLPARFSFLRIDQPNVVVEAVKKAEESDAFIFRLYEAHGASTRARLTFGLPVARVELVNLMEEEPETLPLAENGVTLAFGPFTIHTLRVTPQAQ